MNRISQTITTDDLRVVKQMVLGKLVGVKGFAGCGIGNKAVIVHAFDERAKKRIHAIIPSKLKRVPINVTVVGKIVAGNTTSVSA